MKTTELKTGYKQTEVGVIPEDWEVSSCSELCIKIQDGTHFSPTIGGNDFLYITSKNIRFGFLDITNVDKIDTSQHQNIYKRCDVKFGDLLLTKDGANTGNAAINTINDEFSLLSSVAFLRYDPKKHNANFFMQQILTNAGQQRIKEAMTGNAITRLTLTKIRKLRFPVAPLSEQTLIATALFDTDSLISNLEKLIAKKRNIKQGAMQKLLQPKEGWEVKKLGEIAEIYQPQTISQDVFISDGYLVYGANGIVGMFNKYNHESWQTTITCRGSTCGTVNRTIGKCWITGNAMVMNVDKNISVYKPFFYYLLSRQDFKECITGSGQPQIVRRPLSEFAVSIPEIEEQTRIATILSDMDAEIAALEGKLAKYRDIKLGMMQVLLTGKIRLVNNCVNKNDCF